MQQGEYRSSAPEGGGATPGGDQGGNGGDKKYIKPALMKKLFRLKTLGPLQDTEENNDGSMLQVGIIRFYLLCFRKLRPLFAFFPESLGHPGPRLFRRGFMCGYRNVPRLGSGREEDRRTRGHPLLHHCGYCRPSVWYVFVVLKSSSSW